MKIEIKKFGDRLISRPEGRDSALVMRNQFLNNSTEKIVELDFKDVKILTPSWLDEVLQEIYKDHSKENVTFSNTTNASVKASIETVLESQEA
jgi:hypothetical protein